jgi:hypothetical protein
MSGQEAYGFRGGPSRILTALYPDSVIDAKQCV